jgi:hypothetical protein
MGALVEVYGHFILERQRKEIPAGLENVLHRGLIHTMVSDIEKSDPNACIVYFNSYPFSGFQVLAIGILKVNDGDLVERASLRLDVIVGEAHRDGH